jgi:hypothetical protein
MSDLNTVIQSIINEKKEEAQVALHEYFIAKVQEMTNEASDADKKAVLDKLMVALKKNLKGYEFSAKENPYGVVIAENHGSENEITSKSVKALKVTVQKIADDAGIGIKMRHAMDDNELWVFTRGKVLAEAKSVRESPDAVQAITAAMKAALAPNGARLEDFDIDEGEFINFGIEYDFPEHKVPASELNALLKGVGKASISRSDMFELGLLHAFVGTIKLKTALSKEDADELMAEFNPEFGD